MSNGTSPGVTVKGEGYVTTPTKTELVKAGILPPTTVLPGGVTISVEGVVTPPSPAELMEIRREVVKKYPNLKSQDKVTVAFTSPTTGVVATMSGKTVFDYRALEQQFLAESEARRHTFITAAGIPAVTVGGAFGLYQSPAVVWNQLSEGEKQAVLAYYAGKEGVTPSLGEYMKPFGELAIAMTPIAGTVYFWNRMSTTERVVSAVLDIAIIAMVIKPIGVPALRALKPTEVMRTATIAGKAADKMHSSIKVLRATPLGSTRYATVASRAQKAIEASRLADSKFISTLERVKSLTPSQLATLERRSGITGLKAATLEVSAAQTELQRAWAVANKYTMGSTQYIKNLPRVEQAQARLTRALETFGSKLEPRYKFPVAPEFKGYVPKWQSELVPYFKEGTPIITPLSTRGKGMHLAVLEKAKPVVGLKKVFKLKLKPEFAEGKVISKVKPKAPAVKVKGVSIPITIINAWTLSKVASHYRVAPREIVEAIGEPIIKATTKGVTVTTAKEAIREATYAGVQAAINATPRPLSRVESIVRSAIETYTRTLIDPVAKQVVEVKTTTLTKLITARVVGITPKIVHKGKIVPFIPLPSAEEQFKRLSPFQKAGAVAWKQGFMYKLIYPPYGQNDIINSRKPILGVKIVSGARSAYRSIANVYPGKLPPQIARDMGVFDVYIHTPERGKPKLRYRRDPRQRTTVTPRIGKIR